MGKNYSRNQKRELRNANDQYQTPYCLTRTFIEARVKGNWPKGVEIADFCCGQGAIQKVLKEYGYGTNLSFDIALNERDDFFKFFYTWKVIPPGNNIIEYGIMNPPFRYFNTWVRKCFTVFNKSFALLAPTTYLQGVKRYNAEGTGIFQHPEWVLSEIYTFNRYPMLEKELRPDSKINTGMQCLSWFVWTRGLPSSTTIHKWLDIDSYVVRAK